MITKPQSIHPEVRLKRRVHGQMHGSPWAEGNRTHFTGRLEADGDRSGGRNEVVGESGQRSHHWEEQGE